MEVKDMSGENSGPKDNAETEARVQVGFRLDKDAHRDLKHMALDEGVTLCDLIILLVNEAREGRGLPRLRG